MNLQGRRVLITAGGSGIGLAMAHVFTKAGAAVFVTDINESALKTLKSQLPQVHAVTADAGNERDVVRSVEQAVQALGGLDILINNAGIAGPTGPVEDITLAEWENTLRINITGQFLYVQNALPHLRKGTHPAIVNLSSAAGRLGFAGRTPYSASKWAVIGFTRSLANELGPDGIRVNAICPGAVDGPRIQQVISAKAKMLGKPHAEVEDTYKAQSAMHTMVTADDIANQALFVCSDLALNISGQALAVDGHTEKLF
ncbi:SDR family oxidoreductase [Advenella kashmirensis]|jgi:NAD(P)-dependent dehydrogenase (short-subunit alcohol dehydrogenase family)|uniref:NAD(P)-dependent dehydrogenase (Short-subunit alcohol dehydrogenase family) n=1 Tax=Advenella incenata TaxID=267800 RepID=A0A4Q7VDG3_9BURK|nr:SDR family oxidoreductase [Advenella incenata]RZT93987.1 NAD(P)-dependent dehydrogenase (short-subunit alcohol dehydrogenase family) [Advenella incenata]